jgi:hypothetical protein
MCSSHTLPTLCVFARQEISHTETRIRYSLYIFIMHNCINQILGKLKKESRTDNSKTIICNRIIESTMSIHFQYQYAVSDIYMCEISAVKVTTV